MSHTTTVKAVAVRNETHLRDAVARTLGASLVEGGVKQHNLFSGNTAHGLGVQLEGWRYPVVFDLTTGKAFFDNYNGSWGEEAQLDALLQNYTCAAAVAAAQEYDPYVSVTYEDMENGDRAVVLAYSS